MPQIYLKFSPNARAVIKAYHTGLTAEQLDGLITDHIMAEWGDHIAPEDIACSAEELLYTRGEADVQVEIRYTAGEHEGEEGKAFAPSEESQGRLIERILSSAVVMNLGAVGLTVSVWTKGYANSRFKMGPSATTAEAA